MLPVNYTQDEKIQFNEPELEADLSNNSQFSFNIQVELDKLEDFILNGTNIPLTELTIVDETLLLDYLNQIRANLPTVLATAIDIVNQRQEIMSEAQSYAGSIVKSAEKKAEQIVQESTIVRQAELDGAKIRLQTEQECEQLKQTTQNEIQQWRQEVIDECRVIQLDADSYAGKVLGDIEHKLQEMLTIVRNGRQHLEP
ncbi:hypothetical protein [Pleurocapsa sp. PCC 7319]|uniref:hypothetical protein n=1 Tax=Pleurocapsa sp. PCC 7319 TaxID=118161 RepID=UPI00034BB028|nr:hypothetical protein [Pleurocapsa sp. PCC 7319]